MIELLLVFILVPVYLIIANFKRNYKPDPIELVDEDIPTIEEEYTSTCGTPYHTLVIKGK